MSTLAKMDAAAHAGHRGGSTPELLRGPRRLSRWLTRHRPLAITVVAALAGTGAVVVPPMLDHPDQQVAAEVDGRTWLSLRRSTGPALVLANGISGLVEAQATSITTLPEDARFAGSNATYTLLRGARQAVLVGDGTHRAQLTGLAEGEHAVLAGDAVVLAGQELRIAPINATGALEPPITVPDTGRPVDAAPVVDRRNSTWVLRDTDTGRRAVEVDIAANVRSSVAVPQDTTTLAVVDGRAVARTAAGSLSLGGGRAPAMDQATVIPDVAVATGGAWATASGSEIGITGGPTLRVASMPHEVTNLAVWYGNVWAATTEGLFDTAPELPAQVPGMRQATDVFSDGGRLWFVNRDVAVAIDRQQQVTVFQLSAVDLNLCVGDCSADDAVDYIERQTTTSRPQPADDQASTTTSPAVALTLPPVSPRAQTTTTSTIASVTSTSPATTTPAATATTRPAPPTATTTPTPTTVGRTAPPSTVTGTSIAGTVVPPTSVVVPGTTPSTEPPPTPTTRRPPTPTTQRPPTPTSAAPPPSTTQPPQGGGSIILGFVDPSDPLFGDTTQVRVGFSGSPDQCVGNGGSVSGASTTAEMSWGGATEGYRRFEVAFGDNGASTVETIDIAPGTMLVTAIICGLRTTIQRAVSRSAAPELDPIALSGDPAANVTLTASAAYRYDNGWTPTSSWSFGRCGAETSISGVDGPSSTSASLSFGDPGSYCVSVVVSFRSKRDATTRSQNRTVDVEAPTTLAPTTLPGTTPITEPPPTTPATTGGTTVGTTPAATTTLPGTTVPPTTVPPTTVPPTTVPPTTAPPTTAPPTTVPPTTAPPTTAPPTTVAPTTAPPTTVRPTTTTTTTTVP